VHWAKDDEFQTQTNLNAPEERIEIHLVHGAVVQIGRQTIAPVLLIVGKQMLRACLDTDALNTDNGLVCAFAVKVRVGAEAGWWVDKGA
jgi:hypothetical protein